MNTETCTENTPANSTDRTDSTDSTAVESNTASEGFPATRYRSAYIRFATTFTAVGPNDTMALNVDVPTVMATVLGVLPGIVARRARIAAALPEFDLANIDHLEAYVFALGYVHALYTTAITPPADLPALNDVAVALRDTLYSDTSALVRRGFIAPSRVVEFKKQPGYKSVAADLIGLSTLLQEVWSTISTKSAIAPSDLVEAERLGNQLLTAVGVRENSPSSIAEATANRLRVWTVFAKAWDQVRRAISYLQWDTRDADKIAPSLYAGRGNGNHRKPDATDPAPTTGSEITPANPVVATAAPAVAATPPGTIGLPGSNPFVSGK